MAQHVIDNTNSFFSRNGWTVDINIDGYLVPHNLICQNITISKEENQSNQCIFSLFIPNPVDFIDAVWGKTVIVTYTSVNEMKRMFTGIVAIPEIDIINKSVTLTCSNNRDELINTTMQSKVKLIGRYSQDVQGTFKNASEEMNLRLTTIPYSLDFDSYNTPHFNSWYVKASADITFTDSDIYYRQPKVIWQDRTQIKNDFDITLNYQYTRLYHYQRPFIWQFPFEFCQFLEFQYSLPNVEMIETAITNAKWLPAEPIIFTSVFPPGHCAFGSLLVFWNTDSLANFGTYSTTFDSLGNVISDPDGNNIYGFRPFTKQTDLSSIFTIGASWIGSTRFSQYIQESYTLNVSAPQSIGQFGTVTDTISTDIKDDFDASNWENYEVLTPEPSNSTSFSGGSYYFNEDTNPNAATQAILTQIDVAKTSILSTHRNTQIIIEVPLMSGIELDKTVSIITSKITAKGKVQKILHTIDCNDGGRGSSTTITLALFRSQGSASTTGTYAPIRPTDGVELPNDTIVLGSHYGVTSESYTGHIGNKNNPRVIGQLVRTDVQEEFRVDTPAIPDTYRKLRTLPVTASYTIEIPNDLLSINL